MPQSHTDFTHKVQLATEKEQRLQDEIKSVAPFCIPAFPPNLLSFCFFQHALRRRACLLATLTAAVSVDANSRSDNDAHPDTRPCPIIPSRAARGPGLASASTSTVAHERALLVRRTTTCPPPCPLARTWICG